MDGIHDLGGMHGFGAVADEPEEQRFHAGWHGRMFALSRVLRWSLPFGGDHVRAAIERMRPDHYLRSSYYEKWLEGNLAVLRGLGVVSEEELAGKAPRPLPARLIGRPALPAGEAAAFVFKGMPAPSATPDRPARFRAGDRVVTREHLGFGHTRLPRYARGRPGSVERVAGVFVLADANAAGRPHRETVYSVAFSQRDLWGEEAEAHDSLVLDLWESYLEPA